MPAINGVSYAYHRAHIWLGFGREKRVQRSYQCQKQGALSRYPCCSLSFSLDLSLSLACMWGAFIYKTLCQNLVVAAHTTIHTHTQTHRYTHSQRPLVNVNYSRDLRLNEVQHQQTVLYPERKPANS